MAAPFPAAACFTRRFTVYARGIALLVTAWLSAPIALAASWPAPVDVIYVDSGSPVPRAEAEAAIRYAMAAWAARLDLPLRWSTADPGSSYREGSVVIRWSERAASLGSGENILSLASTRRWVYPSSGNIAAAEIDLRAAAFLKRENDACFRHVVLHELGHALGIGHLADRNAVMYRDLVSCHHTLTEADITAAPYPQHVCHAELLPDLSIYIPVIEVGTRYFASRLRYEAGTWSVAEYTIVAPHPECEDSYLRDDELILTRLWTPERTWFGELSSIGPYQWSLKFAR